METEETKSGNEIKVWNSVLGAALKIPGARVRREEFLRSALGKHVSDEVIRDAIATTPAKAGVSASVVKRAADASIKWHRAGVSAASLAAGLPGGWWIAGTIPADLAQYFWHVVVVSQKLAFLHGWPELMNDEDEIDDETKMVLTLFIGVSMGAEGAATGLNQLGKAVAREVVKRLPRKPLTKFAIYNIAKTVARWLGVSLTKKKFAEYLGKAIPVVGGAVGGGLTWYLFGTGANRLHSHLEGLDLAKA
ncbi:MAG: hypothetical protein R3B40_31785 [Polyangiales bacterium]